MTSIISAIKQWRWYQYVLAVIGLLYGAYVGLSYGYLPNQLKQVVETDVANRIGREIQVESFHYNPFDLSLEVGAFRVLDKPDQPLIAWQRLYVNLGAWDSLLSWNVSIEEIHWEQPQARIESYGDRFNFSDILQRLATEPAEDEGAPPTDDTMAFALEVELTRIEKGFFAYADYSGETVAHSELEDITIEVEDIYLATGDDHLNPFNITAKVPGGGELVLQGKYRIDPLLVETSVTAKGIQLPLFSDFVSNSIPIKISQGVLGLKVDVVVQYQDGLQLLLSNGALSVQNLLVDDAIKVPAFLQLAELSFADVNFDLLQQRVGIGRVAVSQLQTHQWLNEAGEPRFQTLLPDSSVAPDDSVVEAEGASDWSVVVKRIEVADSAVHFADKNPDIQQSHTLDQIQILISDFSLQDGSSAGLDLRAMVDQQGKISIKGDWNPQPFSARLDYGIEALALPLFSEYLEASTWLRIEKGDLFILGHADIKTDNEFSLETDLNIKVDQLQMEDTRTGGAVIQFDLLSVGQITAKSMPQTVHIAQVLLQHPIATIEKTTDTGLNVATLVKEIADMESEPSAEKPVLNGSVNGASQQEPAQSAPWNVEIDSVELVEGTVLFQDKSITPDFTTSLNEMHFSMRGFSTTTEKNTPFQFSSKIDRYAPFTVEGQLGPLSQQPNVQWVSRLDGLELPRLSPYTGTYIGNSLASGHLDLDLTYAIKSQTMEGANNIVAKNLYLGDAVQSEQAVDVPIGLGLALLRDRDGIIALDVGVQGDLNDPGFSISGVVLKALTNVIVKAATSPFELLGSLVGGADDLGEITFVAGSSELNEENRERLTQLAKALAQREQLVLDITGNGSQAEDLPQLKNQRVQSRVAESRKISVDELREEASQQDWWVMAKNAKALEAMNKELKLASLSEREALIVESQPELNKEAVMALAYQYMYQAVAQQQAITVQDVLVLADERALAIKQFLVSDLSLDHQRVIVNKAKQSTLNSVSIQLAVSAL